MTPSKIQIAFDSAEPYYEPGATLSGHYQVTDGTLANPRSVELSVLWYTAGVGDEDMAVHHFERSMDEPPAKPLDLSRTRRFSTQLPISPLSYDGHIVKVCWCVRVRLFLPTGQTVTAEAPFRLGNVPMPVAAKPAPPTAER